jgi:hypothetical protein
VVVDGHRLEAVLTGCKESEFSSQRVEEIKSTSNSGNANIQIRIICLQTSYLTTTKD